MKIQQLRLVCASVAAFAGACVFLLFVWASAVLPGDADVLRHSSGLLDMDVNRVVVDLTSSVPAYRPNVHPLQKLLLAPLGQRLNVHGFRGENRLAAAKLLVAAAMALQVLLVFALARQLAGGALAAGLVASLIFATSFSTLLAATVPESAAFAGLATAAPLVFLGLRWDRDLTGWEALVWGGLACFGLALTITQVMHWAIAFGVRLARWRRSAAAPPSAVAGRLGVALALGAALTIGGSELQARIYPGTPPFYASNPLEAEAPYFRSAEAAARPLRHAVRLLAHFALIDFAAPEAVLSDHFIRRHGMDFWSLSLEEAGAVQWSGPARLLAAAVLLGVVGGTLALRGVGPRFLAPGLCIAGQFALHLLYGREYVIYSPAWHGALVAVLVAAAWNALGAWRRALPWAAALLAAALLANNLAVLRAAFHEIEAGLGVADRGAGGGLRPGAGPR